MLSLKSKDMSSAKGLTISSDDVLIFDLDGTLVQSDVFDDALYQEAIAEVLGHDSFDTDWETYSHVTDTGLLIELLDRLGVTKTDRIIRDVKDAFCGKVRGYLASGADCRALPGAQQAIEAIAAAGIKFGIATGGWGETARMKLRHAGIAAPACMSSSDDAVTRTGIMEHCAARMGTQGQRVIYVGDAPWDVNATALLGWQFIGVGERLRGRCDTWIADYCDPRWLAAMQLR